MSADLERMLSSMRTDADSARLPTPDILRRKGDRRNLRNAVAGLVAVAVLVGGVSFGARELLAGPAGAPIAPAETPTATPRPPATPNSPATPASPRDQRPDMTGSPTQVAAGCGQGRVYPYAGPAHAGQPLPTSVMLSASDWGRCYTVTADRPGYPVRDPSNLDGAAPNVCLDQAPYDGTDADRVAGRFRMFGAGPEGNGFESVTRYRPGSAAAFMTEVRARVNRCATFTGRTPRDEAGDWHAKIVTANFTGDESFLIRIGTGADGATYPGWYVGVARLGDLVIVAEPAPTPDGTETYAKNIILKAVERAG
jgi:hypothetical protein